MSQSSPTIGANPSGLAYRTGANDARKALMTHHKGGSAPSYAEAGMIWLDDTSTPWLFKFYDGSDWIVMGAVSATDNTFKPYNGTAQTVNSFKKATIASATTTDLGTLAGNMAEVTGTTTITSFGSSASTDRPLFYVRFTGALTLTHNGTSLILPGSANITTVAGDAGLFEYLGSGNWRCLGYYRISGKPVVIEETIQIAVGDQVSALSTGTGKFTWRMPWACTLTGVKASVQTAPVGADLIVDVNEGGASVLSTKLSIDDGEKTSATAATAAVISDASLAADAEMTIDIDQVGSSTAGQGLVVTLYVERKV